MEGYYYHKANALEAESFQSTDIFKKISGKKSKASRVFYPEPIPLTLQKDIEYHTLNKILFTPHPLIRKEVLESLLEINLYRIQYLPVDIEQGGRITENYFLLYIYNMIPDLLRTELTDNRQQYSGFESRLDRARLAELSLEERLLFCPEQEPSITIIHQSIKAIFDEGNIDWGLKKFTFL